MRILALDLSARSTGWAVYGDDLDAPMYGSRSFERSASGIHLFEAFHWLASTTEFGAGLLERLEIDEVVIERVSFDRSGTDRSTNGAAAQTADQLEAAAIIACLLHGIRHTSVAVNTWRAHVFGSSVARAPDGGKVPKPRRRAYWKEKAKAWARARGHAVTNDDQAEALCIGAWAMAKARFRKGEA